MSDILPPYMHCQGLFKQDKLGLLNSQQRKIVFGLKYLYEKNVLTFMVDHFNIGAHKLTGNTAKPK